MKSSTGTLTTYSRADGELIFDEFGWVTDLDFFDDYEEPLELVKETWTRTACESVWVGPPLVCAECGEDRENLATGEVCCEESAS